MPKIFSFLSFVKDPFEMLLLLNFWHIFRHWKAAKAWKWHYFPNSMSLEEKPSYFNIFKLECERHLWYCIWREMWYNFFAMIATIATIDMHSKLTEFSVRKERICTSKCDDTVYIFYFYFVEHELFFRIKLDDFFSPLRLQLMSFFLSLDPL